MTPKQLFMINVGRMRTEWVLSLEELVSVDVSNYSVVIKLEHDETHAIVCPDDRTAKWFRQQIEEQRSRIRAQMRSLE